MEGSGAGNGLGKTMEMKGSGSNISSKSLPPCCIKARASVPESEAKCHDTVVSGWFTESQSITGYYQYILSEFFHYFLPKN